MICRLDGNIDDAPSDIRALLVRLEAVHQETGPRRWQLDCRQCRYLGPWAAAIIAAAFLNGRQRGHAPRVRLPSDPPAVRAFCAFSGMAHLFRPSEPTADADHPDCETVPLDVFTSASWNRSDGIIRLLRRHAHLDDEREDQIRLCIQEVVQNVVDHADSGIGGVLISRYLHSKREVRVAVVDRGVGIAASLRKRYPSLTSSSEALGRVIEGGVSSLSRPNNLGLGVSNLFQVVGAAGGRMALFSGDAFAELRPAAVKPIISVIGCSFPGTAALFTLPIPGQAV